ncbi:hypothetical protein H0H92_005266 [Tricholoma furcatifolium]|nr:hypothetical protein H0H92_005266 [Tricholoma furcatifolium]
MSSPFSGTSSDLFDFRMDGFRDYSGQMDSGMPNYNSQAHRLGMTNINGNMNGNSNSLQRNHLQGRYDNRALEEIISAALDDRFGDIVRQNQKITRQLDRIESYMEDMNKELLTAIRKSSQPEQRNENPQKEQHSDPFSATVAVPCLDEDDYPDIKYWYKEKFIAAKKERRALTGLRQEQDHGNTMTWYVEDEAGDPVDSRKVNQIRADARHIWTYLRDHNMAPATWNEVNLAAMNYYESHLCARHPELSYGANNWKAHQIATDNYPSWASNHLTRPLKIKNEPKRNLKRSRSSRCSGQPAKKHRSEQQREQQRDGPITRKKSLQVRNPLATVFPNVTAPPPQVLPAPSSLPSASILELPSQPTSSVLGVQQVASQSPVIQQANSASSTNTPLGFDANPIVLVNAASNPGPAPPSTITSNPDPPPSTITSNPDPAPPSTIASNPDPAPLSTLPLNADLVPLLNTTQEFAPPDAILDQHANDTQAAPSTSLLPPPPPLPAINRALAILQSSKAPAESSGEAPKKKSKKAKAGKANTPKSICKREWIEKNPNGSEEEWASYWNSLDVETLEKYNSLALKHCFISGLGTWKFGE